MTKIYLVRGNLSSLTVLEAELIKKTPEQIHIDPNSVRVAWRASANSYVPYLSSRLRRHREGHFDSLLPAIEFAAASVKKDLERAAANMNTAQLLLTELAALVESQKEASDAN